MANIEIPREYADGEILDQSMLDAANDSIEEFLNVTKINDDNIQTSGITGSTKLLNASVTEAKLAASSISTAKIADGAVTTVKIADSNVTNAKLAADSVNTTQIVAAAVTTAKIADANVTTDKLANDAVTNAKLADDAVQTENIADSAITTVLINNGAVTPAKHSTNYQMDTLNGSRVNSAGTTYLQGTSYTTSGRPVMIVLYGGTLTNNVSNGAIDLSRYDGSSHTDISRISATSGVHDRNLQNSSYDTTSDDGGGPLMFIDVPSAGSYQYELKLLFTTGPGTVAATNVKMIVYEL